MWWKKKVSEVSTSEDDLDSSGGDSDDEEEEQDNEGPTLVTVDDGKGGVKHIKVSDPCRGEDVKQQEDGVVINHLDSR